MKLYLSSYGFGNKPENLLEMTAKGSRVGVIVNALDNQSETIRSRRLAYEIHALEKLGYSACELDLRKYFMNSSGLSNEIHDLNMIWCTGGNAFILNAAMKMTHFKEAVLQRLKNNSLTYGGYSAAAVVAGPSLQGIELVDRIDDFPPSYPEKTFHWSGLGFIDYLIVPHFDSNHSESVQINDVIKYLTDRNLPFKPLRDGEVIVINEPVRNFFNNKD